MDEKIKLFEEYKTLTNRPWFVIDLEKTTKDALQVLVNKTKIKLGIAVFSPAAPQKKQKKFNNLFTRRFGHAPTNHIVSGIINRHNVHAGSSGRKTRKNKY